MPRLRPLFILGTRPEAIKLAPVLHQARRRGDAVQPLVCLTGQHRELLSQVVDYFGIEADDDLALMRPDQPLGDLTARCLEGVDRILARHRPDCIVVQGDTTTVMAAGLAAFYRRVPLVHVEAGLRTGDLDTPWPEELNRRIAGIVAHLHCAPTRRAAENLLREGAAADAVHITGNTVIDALLWTVERERGRARVWRDRYGAWGDRRVVLITAHRRESFGIPFEGICRAILELAGEFGDVEFVYPVHPNPHVQTAAHRLLTQGRNIHLLPPLPYHEFVWLMDRSTLVLTDSGGIQEEAPSLRRPVLVLRDVTERPEAIEAGAAELVGTSGPAIIRAVRRLLTDPTEYARRQIGENPYGDGKAAGRIVDLMLVRYAA